MEQSQLIQTIKNIAASSDLNKFQKLQDVISNKYFNNIIRSAAIIELGKLKSNAALPFLLSKIKTVGEPLKEATVQKQRKFC